MIGLEEKKTNKEYVCNMIDVISFTESDRFKVRVVNLISPSLLSDIIKSR